MIFDFRYWKKIYALMAIGAILIYPLIPSLAYGTSFQAPAKETKWDAQKDPDHERERKEATLKKVDEFGIPFVQNQGQIDNEAVKFYANIFSGAVYAQNNQLTYKIRDKSEEKSQNRPEAAEPQDPEEKRNKIKREKGFVFNEKFAGSRENLAVSGQSPNETLISFFGGDQDKWKFGNFSFSNLIYEEVWGGIDVALSASDRNVEKIFRVNPAGNPGNIRMEIEGAQKISNSENGELILKTSIGEISMTAPVAYQENENGEKVKVDVSYQILKDNLYGFKIGEYDRSKTLIIDPLLAGTSFGSGDYMEVLDIDTDASGNIYASGYSQSTTFPVTVGAYDIVNANSDGYISKFNSDLSALLSSTFFNGIINDILVKDNGEVIAIGDGGSLIPTTAGSYDTSHNGNADGFISIFNNSLTTLLYSTFIGGTSYDYLEGLSLDSNGNIFVVGSSRSAGYPTIGGSFDTVIGNTTYTDIVVSKFNSTLSALLASTFFGSTSTDQGYRVRVDSSNKVFIYGTATLMSMPAGAYQTNTYDASSDPILARFDNNLTTLEAGTYIGGNSWEDVYGMELDASGNVIITGSGRSTFPTTEGAYDRTFNGGDFDFYLAKLNNSLSSLVASTFLGGSQNEWYFFGIRTVNDIGIDSAGNIFFGGFTDSSDYPTTAGAFLESPINGDNLDHFSVVSKFDSNLSQLSASTYFGGTSYDQGGVVHVDGEDNVIIGGITMDAIYEDDFYFPLLPNAYSKSFLNDYEGYLAKLDNDLSAQDIDFSLRADETLGTQDFEGGVFPPAGFTTGGDASWEPFLSLLNEEAAIDAAPLNASYEFNASPSSVFISDLVGYVFYVDSFSESTSLVYRKTTDGGASWGNAVVIDTDVTGWLKTAVWYDRWTPGDTAGNLIHIAAMDGASDDVMYFYLDVSDDSFSQDPVVALAGLNYSQFTNGSPSITKSAEGNLFVSANFASYAGVAGGAVAKSEDSGATWTPYNTDWSTAAIDQVQLLPLETDGDIIALRADTANNDIDYQIYDEVSDSWEGAWTSIAAMTESTSNRQWFSASLEKSNGDIHLSFASYTGNAANDIEFWTFEDGSRSWTKKTNLFTDNATVFYPVPIVNSINDYIYVAYLRDSATANSKNLYFKSSTDGGATWSEESPRLTYLAYTFEAIRGNMMTETRPFIVMYKTTGADSIIGTALTNNIDDFTHTFVRSGNISSSQSSYLQTSHTYSGEGKIKFRWRSSTNDFDDYGLFCIDNSDNCVTSQADAVISGLNDWKEVSRDLSAGTHTFQWKYATNASVIAYEDMIWLDDIQFIESHSQVAFSAGEANVLSINAFDTFGSTGYTWGAYLGDKTVTLSGASSSDGNDPTCTDKNGVDVPFGTPMTLAFSFGKATCDMKLYAEEAVSIDISDGTVDSMGDPTFDLDVTVGAAIPGDEDPEDPDDPEDPITPPSGTDDDGDDDEEEKDHITLTSHKNDELTFDVKISKGNKEKSDSISSKNDESTEVRDVTVTAKKSEKIEGKFKIKDKKEKPEEVIFPGEVDNCVPYQIIDVDADFSDKKVKEAKLSFRIPRGWLKSNKLQKFVFVQGDKEKKTAPQVLVRNKWAVLQAKLINQKEKEDIYQASSSSLDGWWGIYGCDAQTVPDLEEEKEIEPSEPQTDPIVEDIPVPGVIAPPQVGADIDQDLTDETATDANTDPADGYEVFDDPDGSTTVVEVIDGDEDGADDFLLDTDGDNEPDRYWDPDDQIVSDAEVKDVDKDETREVVFGVEGIKPDRYWDPDDGLVKIYAPDNFFFALVKELREIVMANRIMFETVKYGGLAVTLLAMMAMLASPSNIISVFKNGFSGMVALLLWRDRKRRDWGVVYDVKSGRPLPFASVQVINEERGKLAETKVTDKYGSFYFLVSPGTYRMEALKKGFEAAKKIALNLAETIYGNSYDFKPFLISGYDKISKDIPMNKSAVRPWALLLNKKIPAVCLDILFGLGFLSSLLVAAFYPSAINIVIVLVYFYAAFIRNMHLGKVKWGRVVNEFGKPAAFATVRLSDGTDRYVARTIADEKGRYFMIADKGRYLLEAISSSNGSSKKVEIELAERDSIKKKIRF